MGRERRSRHQLPAFILPIILVSRVIGPEWPAKVNAVVATALGSAIPLLLYHLPGIRQLQDFIYYLVASNRSLLPGDQPYCAQHPAECRKYFEEKAS